MSLRSIGLIAVGLVTVVSLTGCYSYDGLEVAHTGDPGHGWDSAVVTKPKISARVVNGRTVVTVTARTTVPLEDREKQTGFGERAAKIAWRTYEGRMDTLEMSAGDDSGHEDKRTWSRTELAKKFGPRLPGLDASRPPPTYAAQDGPFSDRDPDKLAGGYAVVNDLLGATTRNVLGQNVEVGDDERLACHDPNDLSDHPAPTGQYQRRLELEVEIPKHTHQIVVLQRLASYWSRQGFVIDTGRFYSGDAEMLVATLDGVAQVTVESKDQTDTDGTSRVLVLHAVTACMDP